MENQKIQNSDVSGRFYKEPYQESQEDLSQPSRHKKNRLGLLAAGATIAARPMPQTRDWSTTEQDRPKAGVKQRRAKAKAVRKAKQAQRRKGK